MVNTGGTEGDYTVVLTINEVKEAERSVTITGVNDRYINAHPAKLRESLLRYSPLRLIKQVQAGESLVETGESRTPRPEEATQNILQA